MHQARESTSDLPTWEAMREPSTPGDGDSDTDEVDQIRATPAPGLVSHSEFFRPVYKRKESDWKIESAPKRAKRDQSHNIRDNPRQGNQSTVKFHPTSISGPSGDSGSDGAHHKKSTISSGAPSSMLAPPLPSRVRKVHARKSSGYGHPLSKNQSVVTPRPLVPPPASSALKSTPFKVPSNGRDIPSSLDSTLFSNVAAKGVARLHLHTPPNIVPDPDDVIEISSESSDTPPPSLKGKNNTAASGPSSPIRRQNSPRPKKTPTPTPSEIIEILDSDEELEMQRASSRLTHNPSSRVLQSPKRAPSTFRMTTKGKSGVPTPSSVKSSVQDRGKPITSGPACNSSSNPDKRVLDQSRLSTSPTLSRFSQAGINSTSNPSSLITDRTLGQTSLSAGHSQQKTSGIRNVSKEASIAASVSDDDSVNMCDLHAALGIPLPSERDKCKEDTPSTVSSLTIKKRLGKTARKSTGWRNFIRKPAQEARTTIKSAGASCSSVFVIDLTGDASDEEGEQRVSQSDSSKNKNLSTPPTASDTARAVVEHPPLLLPSPPKTPNLMLSSAALSPPRESALQTETNQPLLNNANSPPVESGLLNASEISIPSHQDASSSSNLPSPKPVGIRTNLRQHSLSPNVEMSTNFPLSAGLPHESSCSSSTPLPAETHQQTTFPLSEPAPSTSESGSSSSSSPSIPKQPLLADGENTTQVAPSTNETHSETFSQIVLFQTGSPTPDAMCLSREPSNDTYSKSSSQLVLPQAESTMPDAMCLSSEPSNDTSKTSQPVLLQIESTAPDAMCLSSEADIAEKLLADDESDDAMREADEFDAVIGEGTSSMDEEQPLFGIGMRIDDEAERLSESLVHSQSTIRAIRPPLMTSSSESGLETSSDPGLGCNSPISVPSTRRSSRLSLLSNTSEEADVHHIPSSRSTSPDDIGAFRCSTLGGFPAYRFETYRKDPKNFPKVDYASDLPSSIQDHINNQPEEVRMLSEIRGVFEAMILENTADDERDAPPIVIQNSVDDEPTPPWEFWYSNKMWHGEGVPDPDVKNLKGCDCRGACNPKNKACACAQRQCQAIGGDKMTEFAYDKNGRLKFPGFPIFECNNTCWCGPECTNRIVQHGRKVQVVIRKTENKGWGVFNGTKKIPQGTFIGIYAGELLTDEDAHMRGLKYNKAGTTYLFDLDFHHLKEGADEDWTNLYTVDAYHAGNFTRFLNHSCNPNCRLYPCYINEGDIQKPLLVVFSIRDIEPDAEFCFNYQGIYPGEEDEEDEKLPEEDSDEPKDKIYTKCLCGAKNCRGVMFT